MERGQKSYQMSCGPTEPPLELKLEKRPSSSPNFTEVVIPIEVGLTNMRREFFQEDSNDNQLRGHLDCLDETREEASKKMSKYQQKLTKYYNKRVKL